MGQAFGNCSCDDKLLDCTIRDVLVLRGGWIYPSSVNELAYMTANNDDFDLPRYAQDSLATYNDPPLSSSSAQAAHAAQQAAYASPSYSAPPPPQSTASRQPPLINTHQPFSAQQDAPASARNPRIPHFFDTDSQQGGQQYLSAAQPNLSRSASLGNVIGSSATGFGSRRSRHHMQNDLESAYFDDGAQGNGISGERPPHQQHRSLGTSQQITQSFYPPSVSYATSQQPQLTGHSAHSSVGSANAGDPYQDGHYNTTSGQARRHTTAIKLEDGSGGSRSPRRAQGTGQGTTPLLDPYSQIQQLSSQSPAAAYSPTSAAYQYSSPTEMPAASPYQPHQVPSKGNAQHQQASPLGSPFANQRTLPPPPPQVSSQYSHYPMDTTSPGPSHSSQGTHGSQSQHYASTTMPLRQTLSSPNTPLSYQHAQQLAQAQYHNVDADETMVVENTQKRHRASGFRRVRDQRDLKPYVNPQPSGWRVDTNGQFLSVRGLLSIAQIIMDSNTLHISAVASTNYRYHGYVSHFQPSISL